MTGDLPTIVVIPGLDGTGSLSARFSGGDWGGYPVRVVALPKEGPQDYPSLVETLIPLLPPGRLVLVGESFSGPLAMKIAAQERPRVVALVIAAGFCHSPAPAGLALVPLRPFFMLRPPVPLLKKYLMGPDALPADVTEVADAISDTPAGTLAGRAQVVLALTASDCPALETLPILILQARQDAAVKWEIQSSLERHFPHAEATWIDSPHLLLFLHPDECRNAITGFLKKQDGVSH